MNDVVLMVVSGRVKVLMDDGSAYELGPGHDSWVVGEEPYVSLHLMGAGDYAH